MNDGPLIGRQARHQARGAASDWAWPPNEDDVEAIASLDVEDFVRRDEWRLIVRSEPWLASSSVRPRRGRVVGPLAAIAVLGTVLVSWRTPMESVASPGATTPLTTTGLSRPITAPHVVEPQIDPGTIRLSPRVDRTALTTPVAARPRRGLVTSATPRSRTPAVASDVSVSSGAALRAAPAAIPADAVPSMLPISSLPSSLAAAPVREATYGPAVSPGPDVPEGTMVPTSGAVAANVEPAHTVAAVPSDEPSIREVLHRYGAAYSRLDARAARAVWPAVDGRALERAFSGLRSQQVRLGDCRVALQPSGGSAQATCRGSATWVPRVGDPAPRIEPRQWRFRLSKAGPEGWRIDSVQSR